MADGRSIVVVEPGLLTTVQDLGRPGLMRFGVSPSGALDRAALILGNRLVGNEPGAAALEVTLLGPRLRFSAPAVVVIAGADLGARRGGEPLPRWEPLALAAGDELAFTPSRGDGARAYVCVAGGLAVPPVMGSRSTDLFGGFGGLAGRALRAGDALPVGEPTAPPERLLRRRLSGQPPRSERDAPTRVVLGPQSGRFTRDGVRTFLGSDYAVSASSDRMGMRLTGPPVAHAGGADLISEGIAHGAVQVPGDGRPIVLLAARQTVGGYPKIATAIGADLDALGQRRPGDPVRFAAVEPSEACALTLAYRAGLGEDAVTTAPRGWSGWSPEAVEEQPDGARDVWGAEDVADLNAALRAAGLDSLRVEYDDGVVRFSMELHREA